jgi:hypothetical protein
MLLLHQNREDGSQNRFLSLETKWSGLLNLTALDPGKDPCNVTPNPRSEKEQ